MVVKVERRGASVGGDNDGGEGFEERIVMEADRVDDSVERKGDEETWWSTRKKMNFGT